MTFQPDDDFDEQLEDDEDESEPEPDVFAFHRPTTGAVPRFGASDGFSDVPGTGMERTDTAGHLSFQSTTNFSTVDPTSTTASLPSFAYSADSSLPPTINRAPHPNRFSSSKGHLVRGSTATTADSDDYSFSTTDENGRQAIKMKSFSPMTGGGGYHSEEEDSKWDEESRVPESRGTWVTSEMEGTMTVPDGQTTRGGGEADYEK